MTGSASAGYTESPSLHELSIAQAGLALRAGTITSMALTEHALSRIARLDERLHAFVTVTAEEALTRAGAADRELSAGVDRGPLHGIPYALKDIFATAGIRTTNQSWLTVDKVPTEDSHAEMQLHRGGAVLVGKLSTHEFALGGPSVELPFPPSRNPWNLDHTPGASSSGSGAAVAAGFVRVAIGSDTSGSIRGPACHCGVVGLKPTYGLVSRRGAFPLSFSLDHVGPLGYTIGDTALALGVLAGYDPRDPSTVRRGAGDYGAALDSGVAGRSVGYAREFFITDPSASDEIVQGVDSVVAALQAAGAYACEVDLPDFGLFNACGRIIMAAEGYGVHAADLRTNPRAYGRYTYQRLVPGVAVSASDVIAAQRLRRELAAAVSAVLSDCDVLITANALCPAPRFDLFGEDWPPPPAATANRTIPFNVTGHPALAVPIGFTGDGLPMGVQLVGRPFDESTVFAVGAEIERLSTGGSRWPPGFS